VSEAAHSDCGKPATSAEAEKSRRSAESKKAESKGQSKKAESKKANPGKSKGQKRGHAKHGS
jgi:hypothetical protein